MRHIVIEKFSAIDGDELKIYGENIEKTKMIRLRLMEDTNIAGDSNQRVDSDLSMTRTILTFYYFNNKITLVNF